MINDNEGMNNALDYYMEQDKITHYWGDWTDEDPVSEANPYSKVDEVTNVDSGEEMEEEQDYWEGYEYDDDDDDWDSDWVVD